MATTSHNIRHDTLSEQAGYFAVPGAHLYTVLHGVRSPVARVLLVGPFATERLASYIPWVRWARYLAARGIECLRFDYRGVGESTGNFEEMSFDNWIEDVELLANWLKSRSPSVPVVLHGLALGAILAAKIFEVNVGAALLLWAAPANANQSLRQLLFRRILIEQAFSYGIDKNLLSHYIQQLESGQPVEVDGYLWSSRLWRDSFNLVLPASLQAECDTDSTGRPVKSVKLDSRAVPLVDGSSVGYDSLNKDFTAMFADNYAWIAETFDLPQRGNSE